MWSKTAQNGGVVSLDSTSYDDNESSISGTQYRVSYYNKSGQRLQLPRDAYVTIFTNYEPSTVKCYRISNSELKEMECESLNGAVKVELDGADTFILTGSVKEDIDEPNNDENQDLARLWITLGVGGGVIGICGIGALIYFFIIKKK